MPFSLSPELQEIMFSKKLKEASLQKSRQQMTHTQSSTQEGPKQRDDPLIPTAQASEEIGRPKPVELDWRDEAVEWGLKQYKKYKDDRGEPLQTNQRVFYETMIEGKTQPITEKDFSEKEVKALRELLDKKVAERVELDSSFFDAINKRVRELPNRRDWTKGYPEFLKLVDKEYREYKKTGKIGKKLGEILSGDTIDYWENYVRNETGNIKPEWLKRPDGEKVYKGIGVFDYLDYGTEEEVSEHRKATGENSPLANLHTVLGRFSAKINPETQSYEIREKYDFNTPSWGTTPNYSETTLDSSSDIPYNILRNYAGRKGQAGAGVSRDVDIKIPRRKANDP